MFIDKKGVKCRNLQEQVEQNRIDCEKNSEDIAILKHAIEILNLAYIEIDDSQLVGHGDLTDEQVEKLTGLDFVYVVLKRAEDVYLAFGSEKYQEENVIIKSLSASGYSRTISFDLEAKTWDYYETDTDVEQIARTLEELGRTVQGHIEDSDIHVTEEEKSTWNHKQDGIAYIDIDQDEGTLSSEQIAILQASELNYIWYNNMHRLTFRYRDNNAGLSTYASNDQNQYHSIEINVQTGHYVAYNGYCEKEMTGGTNVNIDREHGESPIINVPEAAVSVLTVAPTSRYIDGGAKIVHLSSSEGVTEYDGYIYMYDED